MITIFHLGLVAFEPAYREQGVELQPALWSAVGGCVCVATAKARPEHGFTRPVKVLTREGRPWRPGVDVDSELGREFNHLAAAKGLIAAKRLSRSETLFVTPEVLEGLKRHQVKTWTTCPTRGLLRLFAAAKETKLVSSPKPGVHGNAGHWAVQGSDWQGQKGNYVVEDQHGRKRLRELKEGWSPGEMPGRFSL